MPDPIIAPQAPDSGAPNQPDESGADFMKILQQFIVSNIVSDQNEEQREKDAEENPQ